MYTEYGNRLNPCFNGTYSMRIKGIFLWITAISLNPCFNGTYSMRTRSYNEQPYRES